MHNVRGQSVNQVNNPDSKATICLNISDKWPPQPQDPHTMHHTSPATFSSEGPPELRLYDTLEPRLTLPASAMAAGPNRPAALLVASYDMGQGISQDSQPEAAQHQQPAAPYLTKAKYQRDSFQLCSHRRTGVTTSITSISLWKTSSPC